MKVKLGALIIGSLYWDNQPNRLSWRSECLDIGDSKGVLAPIRYGRRSQTRGNSYTMVLSQGLGHEEARLGKAIVAPFKRHVEGVPDIVEQAELLWAAERNSSSSNSRISANWGCIGLILNPALPMPEELCGGWAERVSSESGFGQLRYASDETLVVKESGVLSVPWPKCLDGSSLKFHALIATATNPTLDKQSYPSASQVAEAWKTSEGKSHVNYFWKNRENNICTFQDSEIAQCLNGDS